MTWSGAVHEPTIERNGRSDRVGTPSRDAENALCRDTGTVAIYRGYGTERHRLS